MNSVGRTGPCGPGTGARRISTRSAGGAGVDRTAGGRPGRWATGGFVVGAALNAFPAVVRPAKAISAHPCVRDGVDLCLGLPICTRFLSGMDRPGCGNTTEVEAPLARHDYYTS